MFVTIQFHLILILYSINVACVLGCQG